MYDTIGLLGRWDHSIATLEIWDQSPNVDRIFGLVGMALQFPESLIWLNCGVYHKLHRDPYCLTYFVLHPPRNKTPQQGP